MNQRLNIILAVLTIILSGLLTMMSFSEWYVVKFQNQATKYPFGGESPTPYYYKTAQLYSTVNFVWGIVFLVILIFTSRSILKGHKNMTLLSFIMTIFLLFAFIIQGQIES